jgi:hypothetical protein
MSHCCLSDERQAHQEQNLYDNADVSPVRQSESFIYTGGYIYKDPHTTQQNGLKD